VTVLDLSRAPSSATAAPVRANLAGLSRDRLRSALVESGVVPADKAKMRAGQLWRWIHHFGVTDFEKMTDIAKEMRTRLVEHFTVARPEIVERQVSVDGVRKWLIRFAPGIEAETVFIPDVASRTGALCVSSQVGCTLNCTFCHTGTQPLVRNLTAGEIIAQLQVARDDLGEWPAPKEGRQLSNIVFMGMGEPLYNLDNVAEAIDIMADNEGLAISRRRITVSTSGVVPELEKLGEAGAMLAVSLHATNDELRDQLVPLNRKYPIEQLMAGIRAYPGLSNAKRVTFEYVMLKGVNDSPADARALVRLVQGIPAKINLIPFNPWPGAPYECSDRAAIDAFAGIVNKAGYAAPVRRPRGRDILAACGQLKSESEKLRASERRKLASQAAPDAGPAEPC
jgi:23S rRNA (adenine2503-C2)-methyltransferase